MQRAVAAILEAEMAFDESGRGALMARVKSKNTAPELAVRKHLHAAGLRFAYTRRRQANRT